MPSMDLLGRAWEEEIKHLAQKAAWKQSLFGHCLFSYEDMMSVAALAFLEEVPKAWDGTRPLHPLAYTIIKRRLIDYKRTYMNPGREDVERWKRYQAALWETGDSEKAREKLGWSVEAVDRVLVAMKSDLSFELSDNISASSGFEAADIPLLNIMKVVLNKKQYAVVEGYYLLGRTEKSIGVSLGVTESRVSQLLHDALGRLKDYMNKAKYRP